MRIKSDRLVLVLQVYGSIRCGVFRASHVLVSIVPEFSVGVSGVLPYFTKMYSQFKRVQKFSRKIFVKFGRNDGGVSEDGFLKDMDEVGHSIV